MKNYVCYKIEGCSLCNYISKVSYLFINNDQAKKNNVCLGQPSQKS